MVPVVSRAALAEHLFYRSHLHVHCVRANSPAALAPALPLGNLTELMPLSFAGNLMASTAVCLLQSAERQLKYRYGRYHNIGSRPREMRVTSNIRDTQSSFAERREDSSALKNS